MLERVYKITKSTGLDARVASKLVSISGNFSCDIKIKLGNIIVDFKSIMGVMSLNAQKGEIITLIYSGNDEVKASDEIDLLIKDILVAKEY